MDNPALLTDANQFYNLSHAICIVSGAGLMWRDEMILLTGALVKQLFSVLSTSALFEKVFTDWRFLGTSSQGVTWCC